MTRVLSIPRNIGKFFSEVAHELRLTEFPNRQTSLRLTYTVLGTSVIGGIILLLVDWLLLAIRTYLTTVNN
jgi:preprotein translocase SecE subunit